MQKTNSYGPLTFELLGDGFLTTKAEPNLKELEIDKEFAEAIIEKSLDLLDGKACPFLFLYGDLDVTMTREAHTIIAKHKGLGKIKKAEAIVTLSLANRLVINLFTAFFKPPRPVKVFKTEAKARKWLSQFL